MRTLRRSTDGSLAASLGGGGTGLVFALVLAGLISGGVGGLQAAVWYVDKAATGANNGRSWTDAWTNFSSVVWGSAGVKAGDTLYISGGSSSKVYTESWTVGASGTAGSPIRIAIDAANPQHNGQVIFDYDFAGDQAAFHGITCHRSYVVFDGEVAGEARLVISNLRNYMNRYACYGIYASGTTGLVVKHLLSTNCNNPVRIASSTGFRVSNCGFYQVRGDAAIDAGGSSGGWDANLVYSNMFELLCNYATPSGKSSAYVGPDGVQCSHGLSVFRNTFLSRPTTLYTSDQHTDDLQATGNYLKIYENEFINVGDSIFDYDCYANANPHDVWIYNNVFRITNSFDRYPEYFRLYASFNSVSSISNFKIFNNTFIDNNFPYRVIRFDMFRASPTATGIEIKNNLFYNCGGGNSSSPIIYIEDSSGFTASSFSFGNNIYYSPTSPQYVVFRGTTYTTANWVGTQELTGSTAAPVLMSYAPFAPGNNFRLAASDAVARNRGISLAAFFTTDKDGNARGADGAWDIGAYEFQFSGPNTNPIAYVDPVRLDFGAVPVGGSAQTDFTLQNRGGGILSGSITAPAPFSVISGGSFQLASNQSQVVTVRYSPTAAGSHAHTLVISAGSGAAVQLSGTAWAVLPGTTFESFAGTIAAPFVTNSGGYISQSVATGLAGSGSAVYGFRITNAGYYVVAVNLNAPDDAANSLFLNMDGEPTDPGMIWDIPVTSGFETRIASWRGKGTFDQNEFVPVVFHLTADVHRLVIRGREAGVQVGRISILPQAAARPSPPQRLRIVNPP